MWIYIIFIINQYNIYMLHIGQVIIIIYRKLLELNLSNDILP